MMIPKSNQMKTLSILATQSVLNMSEGAQEGGLLHSSRESGGRRKDLPCEPSPKIKERHMLMKMFLFFFPSFSSCPIVFYKNMLV